MHCCGFNTKNKSQIYFSLMASITRTQTKRNVAYCMYTVFVVPTDRASRRLRSCFTKPIRVVSFEQGRQH